MSEHYCSHTPPCCPQVDALKVRVERLETLLGDIQYRFQNIWALDRKAFQD